MLRFCDTIVAALALSHIEFFRFSSFHDSNAPLSPLSSPEDLVFKKMNSSTSSSALNESALLASREGVAGVEVASRAGAEVVLLDDAGGATDNVSIVAAADAVPSPLPCFRILMNG